MKNEIVWEKLLIPKFKYDDTNMLYDVVVIRQCQYLKPDCVVDIIESFVYIDDIEKYPAMFMIEFAGEKENLIEEIGEGISEYDGDSGLEFKVLETVNEDHEEFEAYYKKHILRGFQLE